jgi:hypothetical protein
MNAETHEPLTSTPLDTTPADDRPVHLAKCDECGHTVRFRPSATGAGFVLVDAGDATYGVGEAGRPICPDGHGEMAVADDQLKPAAEAFAEVAARQAVSEPVQRTLPGVGSVFNYSGCMNELEDQALLVRVLEDEQKEAARAATDAQKRLKDAKDKLVAMTLTFRDRRRAKEAPGPDPKETGARSPRLVKCTWEALHADAVCPLCGPDQNPILIEQYLGNPGALPPSDAEAHVDAVAQYLTACEIDETREALEALDTYIGADVIGEWTAEERASVRAYVDQQELIKAATLGPGVDRLERPKVLGTPHLPAVLVDGIQTCAMCNEVLPLDDDHEAYEVTDLVGTDCRRKPQAEPHRYPQTGKKKKTTARSRGKSAPSADETPAPPADNDSAEAIPAAGADYDF